MAKLITDAFIDGGLDKFGTATRITVLSAQPASISDITTTYKLASTTLSCGDFTKANGDSSGRKSTVAQKSSVSITASGTATHVSYDDGTDYAVTTCTSQALTSGGSVTIPTCKLEIADPT